MFVSFVPSYHRLANGFITSRWEGTRIITTVVFFHHSQDVPSAVQKLRSGLWFLILVNSIFLFSSS